MVNNRLHLFSCGYSGPRPGLIALFFAIVLLLLWAAGPLLVFPGVTLLVPAYIALAGASTGSIGGALCALPFLVYAFYAGGMAGGICLLFMTVPALLAGGLCIAKEKPFASSLTISFCALFAGALAATALALYCSQGRLSTLLTERLEAYLRANEHTDTWLTYGYLSGLLPLSREIRIPALALPASSNLPGASNVLGQRIVLNPQAREQLLSSLLLVFDTSVCRDLPGQLLTGSILGAVLLQMLPRQALRRAGVKSDLPALRTWCVPAGRGWLIVLPCAVAALWFSCSASGEWATFTYASGAYIAFSAYYGALTTIFAIQGLAVLDETLYRSGKSRALRTGLAVAGFLLLRRFAVLFGLADQIFDFRRLRRPPEDDDHDKQEDDF